MPTQINGSTGVSKVQDGVVVQADLAANVVGNGPAFSAYLNSSQSLTNNTFVKLLCGNETFDSANAYDSTTNYRFQPTVAGYYSIEATSRLVATSMTDAIITIYKNGSAAKRGSGTLVSANAQTCSVSGLIYLNGTTDYVEVYAYTAGASGNLATGGVEYTWFQGFLARAA